MTAVVFYEKPGCLTNARQRVLLLQHGCELTVRNLLSEPWTEDSLYAFLNRRPVSEWFNPAAPKIRSGEIDPGALDRESAMALLLADPLLIRRPLLETRLRKVSGFDDAALLELLGVPVEQLGERAEGCSRAAGVGGCPDPG